MERLIFGILRYLTHVFPPKKVVYNTRAQGPPQG